MAVKLTSTQDYSAEEIKCLVFSPAGYGKTTLCKTCPDPIIISAEGGLLSLADVDIPVIEIKSVKDLDDAYHFMTASQEAKQFKTVCIDSISEIAEVLIITYKKQNKDPRQAYGRYNDDMSTSIRHFRDLKGKHCYFTAKLARNIEEGSGVTTFLPSMPGKTMLNALPFFFDEVFSLRFGQLPDRTQYRYLQTNADLQYDCKDRSGKLLPKEKPDMSYIFNKITKKEVSKIEKMEMDKKMDVKP